MPYLSLFLFFFFYCFCFLFFFLFFWYKYCSSCFLVISIFIKYIFLSPHFQFICVLCPKVGLLWTVYCRLFFFFWSSLPLHLLLGAFSPLTFKVIIGKYVFIAILNLVFQLILCSPLVILFYFIGFFLCLCPLFIFYKCVVWFWFVVALFF